jgi:hypothetical protein
MKRKLVILACVLALLLTGCAVYQAAKAVLCNPTPEQVAAAEAAIAFSGSVQPLIGTALNLAEVVGVFTNVRAKICVTLDQLEAAIKTVEAAGVQVAKAKGLRATPALPNLAPLKAALAGR